MVDFIERTIAGQRILLRRDQADLFGQDDGLIKGFLHVGSGDIFLDLGFGPGTWSLVAASMGAHVHAFDPRPLACQILSEHVIANRFRRVVIHPCAVWRESGELSFGVSSAIWGVETPTKVPAITMDEFVSDLGESVRSRIRCVNMDVEGAELAVLEGAVQMLRDVRPVFIIEIHENLLWQTVAAKLNVLMPDCKIALVGNHLVAGPDADLRGL